MRQGIASLIVFLILTTTAYGQLPPSPYAIGFEPTFDAFKVVWHYKDINVIDLNNDLGVSQQYYLVTKPGSVGRVLVEFAGLELFTAVDKIMLYIWGSDPFPEKGDPESPFVLTIYDHVPTTIHDSAVWGPYVVFAEEVPDTGGWFGFPVHRGFFSSGRLYVEFRWQMDTPKAPLPTLDWQPGNTRTYRGTISGEQLVWIPESKGNLLLQLRCNISDTVPGFELPADLPDSFAVFLGEDSSSSITTINKYLSVTDSLHCTLPRVQTQGKYVTLGAWNSGVFSNRTKPIYLNPSAPLAFPLRIEPESFAYTIGLGDTNSVKIAADNVSGRAIRYAILPQSRQVLTWLSWDSVQTLIMPNETDTLALQIDGTVLELGTYYDTLVVHCESDSFFFRNLIMPITLIVDQATEVTNELPPNKSNIYPDQNYPNPFNNITVIHSSSPLPITVYNIIGRVVATLAIAERFTSKDYRFNWDGNDQSGVPVASGIYFYRQQGSELVRKMVLSK